MYDYVILPSDLSSSMCLWMTHRVANQNVSDSNMLVVHFLMIPRWIKRHTGTLDLNTAVYPPP